MERQSNPAIELIYENLKYKLKTTELENDILDSIKELNKKLVDRDSLIFRIRHNIAKYNWLVQEETLKMTTLMLQGVQLKFTPYEKSSDTALLDKLLNQIVMIYSYAQQQNGYFLP